jgi:esterase/lipase
VLNTISQKIGWSKGIMPFKKNIPEHPQINYQQIPVAAVHQLFLLIGKTKARLKKLDCPVLLLQGDNDPVVDASSIDVLLKHIRQPLRSQQWISSDRHGILYENTENCQQRIIDFIKKQSN